jgi:hypothetical protein
MKKIIKYITIAFMLPILVTSCLKDNELIGPDADGAIDNIIEFGNLAVPASDVTSSIPLYALSFDMEPQGVVNLVIKCVGSKPATSDIKVSIEIDNSLLSVYNEENEKEYVALPAAQYSLSATEVTIKSGEREAIIPLNLKPDQFTFDEEYALGFKISTVSSGVISGNFGKIVTAISGKNPYDGSYNYTTSAITSLVPNANKSVKLETVGANRVKFIPGLLGTYSNEVFYTVDPTTNHVTVECPSLGVQTPQDTRSKWDPATKTMTVYWKQGNGGRTFEEVFTFTGPR